jgi:xylulokinase
VLRAVQEGIVFALRLGLDVMREAGVTVKTVRAGNANMFKSDLFARVFATVCNTELCLYDTDGSQGAARGAGMGAGIYKSEKEAFLGLKAVRMVFPQAELSERYTECYGQWLCALEKSRAKHLAAERIRQTV